MRRTLVCLLALSVTSLCAPAAADDLPSWGRPQGATHEPPEPAARVIGVDDLPRGLDARIDHLQDGVLHPARGSAFDVGLPSTDDQQALLGRSDDTWLVAWGSGQQFDVSVVGPGLPTTRVPMQRSFGYGSSTVSWKLSKDGGLLLGASCGRGQLYLGAFDLVGSRLEDLEQGGCPLPFDVDQGRVITIGESQDQWRQGRSRVHDWRPESSAYAKIARFANGADIEHDLLFVWTSKNFFGPTSLSRPTTPPWSRPFHPIDVSPDGRRVIGLHLSRSSFDDPAVLEVRRLRDGRLIDRIDLLSRITEDNWSTDAQHEQTMAWESDRAFVFQAPSPRGATLVRCHVSRPLRTSCERASDTGGNISFAHEDFWWPELDESDFAN